MGAQAEQSDLVSVAGALFLILTSLWVFWCFLETKSPVYGALPRPTREVSSRSPLPTPQAAEVTRGGSSACTMQIPQLKTPPPTPAVSKGEEEAPKSSSRIERLIHETGCTTKFFLAWTTSVESFTLRYRRTIESTLKHHPDACVIVYSPTLPQDHFSRFTQLGYRIIVERPDVAALLQGTPAQPWYEQADKWRNGPYFFSHITEIIRLATLYKYGGVYLDTDVIVMRPLSELRNCVGTELHGPRGEAQVLNGAVLIFDQGSPFVWECMLEHNRTYRIDSWGWNGPELVTRVAGRFPTGPDLNILPTTAFYPIHWGQIQQFFSTDDLDHQRDVWQRLSQQTFLFHYWNKVTKDLVPEPSSLMYKVFNNFCIFCADSGADSGADG